ncbi:MAG: DNA starvation/stationary phase protection protein [Chloroflexaceae bacterium]|nr:DNA starvation/stationary phase protection protein [Chloroflexaceae bacterium]NJO04920.1 DNA starvation/stationary phase protection protein [Chloroflexaceae bacterium]
MEAQIGLTNEQTDAVHTILRRVLSDSYVLYTKTRNYHWNVTGPHFHSLHEMFQDQYEALDEVIDDTAERIRAVGPYAIGTLDEFSEFTTLSEHPGVYPDALTMVGNLTADYEAQVRLLRQDVDDCTDKYHDMGTADYLTGLMEKYEKTAWMLRSLASGDHTG